MLAGIVIQLAVMVFYVLYMAIWAWKAKVQVKRAGRKMEIMLLGMFVASVGIIVRGVNLILLAGRRCLREQLLRIFISTEYSATVLPSWKRASTAGSRNSRSGNSSTPSPSPSRLISSSRFLSVEGLSLREVLSSTFPVELSYSRILTLWRTHAASLTLTGTSSTRPKSMLNSPCPKSRTLRPNRRARPRPTRLQARRRLPNVQLRPIRPRRTMSLRSRSVIRLRDALARAPPRCRDVRQRRAYLAGFPLLISWTPGIACR